MMQGELTAKHKQQNIAQECPKKTQRRLDKTTTNHQFVFDAGDQEKLPGQCL